MPNCERQQKHFTVASTSLGIPATDAALSPPTWRSITTPRGRAHPLPLFLPVCQLNAPFVPMQVLRDELHVDGGILNAYFLYKQRALRDQFAAGLTLREYAGIGDGLLVTDSGAFQGFVRKLFLSNETIVAFQEQIGTDVSSPLDLVTPPGDKRTIATDKLVATNKRIRAALPLVEKSMLAGVQQGGRFLDLRRRSTEELTAMGVKYLAIGSLVPFFNRNHDLAFVGKVLRDARAIIGPDIPMHVYGAGDPVEIPFFAALGADIFDSSSFGHYARKRAYMTPFGAIDRTDALTAGEYRCPCRVCTHCDDWDALLGDEPRLAEHNVAVICETIRQIRAALAENRLETMLAEIARRHMAWFPGSALGPTWESLQNV
jgi:7-cyano-7-deazaguanine tRNA-ribosyltransferase